MGFSEKFLMLFQLQSSGAGDVKKDLSDIEKTQERLARKKVITMLDKNDKVTGKQIEAVFSKVGTETKKTRTYTDELINAFKRVAVVVPVWHLARFAISTVTGAISGAVKTLIDWEQEMAQIKIVGGATAIEYDTLSKKLLNLASTFGIANKELGAGARLWSQQGRAIAEIPALMETTIKLALVTGRTMAQSVEDLTAILKSYNIEAQRSGDIVDKLVKVEIGHAITTDVLVAALKIASPVANQFGVSLEKLMGIITASGVVTRDAGEKLGNAWKTIFSRIGTTAKTAIQEIARIPIFLDETGKATFRQTSNFRSFEAILDELAISWATLSKVEIAALGRSVAGQRQISIFTAGMRNWKESVITSAEALNSFGESNRVIKILTETTASKIQQLNGVWNEFILTLVGGTRGFKLVLDDLKLFTEGLIRLTSYLNSDALGKYFDWQKKIGEESKRAASAANEKIAKLNQELALAEQLKELLNTRNRLEALGTKDSKERIKLADEFISIVTKNLAKQQDFANILEQPVEGLLAFLKEKTPEIAENLIGKEAEIKVQEKLDVIQDKLKNTISEIAALTGKAGTRDIKFFDSKPTIEELDKAKSKVVAEAREINKEIKSYFAIEDKEMAFNRLEAVTAQVKLIEKAKKLLLEEGKITSNKTEALKEQGDLIKLEKEIKEKNLDIAENDLSQQKTLTEQEEERFSIERELNKLKIQNANSGELILQKEIESVLQSKFQLDPHQQIIKLEELRNKLIDERLQKQDKEKSTLESLLFQYEKAGIFEKEKIRAQIEINALSDKELISKFKEAKGQKKELILENISTRPEAIQGTIAKLIAEQSGFGTILRKTMRPIAEPPLAAFPTPLAQTSAETLARRTAGGTVNIWTVTGAIDNEALDKILDNVKTEIKKSPAYTTRNLAKDLVEALKIDKASKEELSKSL